MNRWWVFIQERFEPVSHLLMIGSFAAAHAVATARGAGQSAVTWVTWRSLFLVLPGVVAFFFLLRLYDEIKDDEYDRHVNPDRPLARGVVSRRELKFGISICIAIVFASFGAAGLPAWCGIAAAVAYSWLMYCEFFIGDWLRPKLTTYAVSHTAVSVLLSMAMLSAMTGRYPWAFTPQHGHFAVNSWLLFNTFEFGRKTFLSSEERE
jgi:4-hydroxybenzoate polyprenyltransferase